MAGVTDAVAIDAPLTVRDQIEARADHEQTAEKTVAIQHERSWTYRELRDQSVRTAQMLRRRLGRCDDARPGHVAMVLENHLELLSLYGGCAYGGLTLFGVNTGLRGDVLAGVLNQSRSRLIVIDEKFWPELERVAGDLEHVDPENILVLPADPAGSASGRDFRSAVADEGKLALPDVAPQPDQPLMVIYTSGTTGLPKGINNNHFKLCAVGMAVSNNMGLRADDRGYACMPLFHSNAMFVGFMPAFWVGGSMVLRERFSASNFVPDVLEHGVTCWNYVGEPVHYVLGAIERAHGGDRERIRREVTENPKNCMRYAVGNGAAAPDIDKFTEYMGLEDMFELYGSTEAAISTFRRTGDPRGSVGEVTDEKVQILSERGQPCPPAEVDADGKILNYEDCVGEICRVAEDTALFQGYFDNPDANESKYRDGVYHSGDLGHILVRDGKRYLFFDGRTDDWIRKDGENFSASQVGRILSEHPDVPLAVAYGVPCQVSDELVMAALKLRPGAEFDPAAFHAWCDAQVSGGSMDRKWFPDFVRVVDDFEYTQTQKVLVRHLKKVHFDLNRTGSDPVYFRVRGDEAFRPLTRGDYEGLRKEFEAAEKLDLLDR